MLIREPLLCNLIDEKAEKFLFVDAASSTGVLGSVLLQKIEGNNEKIVPEHLDLDNEVHRIIFDKDRPYEPVKLVTSLPVVKVKPTAVKTIPPNVLKEERLLGFYRTKCERFFLLEYNFNYCFIQWDTAALSEGL